MRATQTTTIAAALFAALLIPAAHAAAQNPAPAPVPAQTHDHDHAAPATPATTTPSSMEEKMKAMQQKMKGMEAEMAEKKAAGERLDALVKVMNEAPSGAQTAAIMAVVNEMVSQQNAMKKKMAECMKAKPDAAPEP